MLTCVACGKGPFATRATFERHRRCSCPAAFVGEPRLDNLSRVTCGHCGKVVLARHLYRHILAKHSALPARKAFRVTG